MNKWSAYRLLRKRWQRSGKNKFRLICRLIVDPNMRLALISPKLSTIVLMRRPKMVQIMLYISFFSHP
jgi:hypothetical protein